MTTTSFGEDMASVRESMLLSVGIAGFSSLVVVRGRVGCSRCASSLSRGGEDFAIFARIQNCSTLFHFAHLFGYILRLFPV